MAKIFEAQNALRINVNTRVDVTGASATIIKYIKPDSTTGSFTATIDTTTEVLLGRIYYDVVNTSELDQNGTWIMWAYVTFADSRVAQGLPIKVRINEEGVII